MLAICRTIPKDLNEFGDFKVGGIYRFLYEGKTRVFVNGYNIPRTLFDKHFNELAPILKELLKRTGFVKRQLLTKDAFESYTAVSKSEYEKNVLDLHTYGKGQRKLFIAIVGHPKENGFQIFIRQGSTKAEAVNYSYNLLSNLLNDKPDQIEWDFIYWTDRGIPIGYTYNDLVGKVRPSFLEVKI